MLASLESTGARLIGIPTDADRFDVGALERALARYPVRLVALQPVCQREFYRGRLEALLAALDRHLPGECQLLTPAGGHSVWLTLRRRIDEQALYTEAMRQGVAITPGAAALVEQSQQTSLRLSFSLADEQRIDEGIGRLASAFRTVLRASGSARPLRSPESEAGRHSSVGSNGWRQAGRLEAWRRSGSRWPRRR